MINSKKSTIQFPALLAMLVPLTLLTACGGSSNGAGTTVTATSTVWVKDQFQASSNFASQCENPRIGSSPITGKAYPDKSGSELIEKFWQRSFNNETYLWYQDVIDKDPQGFSLTDYFDQLKTTEVTDSGRAKDRFHWSQSTKSVEESTQLGVTYGYGVDYKRTEPGVIPRIWQVQNITPGVQAVGAISRGSQLLAVDGVDFVNGSSDSDLAIISAALFGTNEGEEHTFKYINLNGEEYEVTLANSTITGVPLQLAKTMDTPQGNVGYLLLNSFNNAKVEKKLVETFTKFSQDNITDLVVDLRYNGGGFLALSSQLAYMVAGKTATQGKTYDRLIYNDKLTSKNRNFHFEDKTIDLLGEIGGETLITAGQPLPTLDLARVYVLTTGSSCSASESFINSLKGIDVEVIQIGETTCGKPYGFVSEDNCGETYFTVQFRGENHKGFGDFADGLIPTEIPEFGKDEQIQGCPIEEDYLHALGDQEEILLASALYYQTKNACPAIEAKVANNSKSIKNFASARSNGVSVNDAAEYTGAKLDVRTPLQDAIINDIYFDKYRHMKESGK